MQSDETAAPGISRVSQWPFPPGTQCHWGLKIRFRHTPSGLWRVRNGALFEKSPPSKNPSKLPGAGASPQKVQFLQWLLIAALRQGLGTLNATKLVTFFPNRAAREASVSQSSVWTILRAWSSMFQVSGSFSFIFHNAPSIRKADRMTIFGVGIILISRLL
jgi:hypothetical protein